MTYKDFDRGGIMGMTRSFRFYVLLILLLAAMGVAGSFFAQYVMHLKPCNMCILQRVAMIALLVVSLVLFFIPVTRTGGRVVEAILLAAPAVAGLTVSIRQIWLQSLPPDKVPSCGPGFDFVWRNNPKLDALKILFLGDGDCAKVEKVLFVPLPIWATLFFSLVVCLAILGVIRSKRWRVLG